MIDITNITTPEALRKAMRDVPFHKDIVVCVDYDENHYFSVHRICENLEIDYPTELRKIKKDDYLKTNMVKLPMLDNANRKFPMVGLPIEDLNLWLAGVNFTKKVPKDDPRREKLRQYKAECARVLFEYFLGGGRARLSAVRAAWGRAKYDLRWFFRRRRIGREAAELLFRDAFGGTMPSTLGAEYDKAVWEQGGNPAPALSEALSLALDDKFSPAPCLLGAAQPGAYRPPGPSPD